MRLRGAWEDEISVGIPHGFNPGTGQQARRMPTHEMISRDATSPQKAASSTAAECNVALAAIAIVHSIPFIHSPSASAIRIRCHRAGPILSKLENSTLFNDLIFQFWYNTHEFRLPYKGFFCMMGLSYRCELIGLCVLLRQGQAKQLSKSRKKILATTCHVISQTFSK